MSAEDEYDPLSDCVIAYERLQRQHDTLAAELAKLRDACGALLAHWDRNGEPERHVTRDSMGECDYWSPATRMVDSSIMAPIREALAKGRAG